MTARCNANGVYEADERLSLQRATKGWRGCNLADIKLANLGAYWIWATSFQMHTGDCHGSSSPLWDHEPTQFSNPRAPSREAAIEAASAELGRRLTPRSEHCADARAVLAWLGTLNPAQADLFA